ncbi:MAG: hypothetical protein ACXWV2_04315 [Chitinophagaceae bacterium]
MGNIIHLVDRWGKKNSLNMDKNKHPHDLDEISEYEIRGQEKEIFCFRHFVQNANENMSWK